MFNTTLADRIRANQKSRSPVQDTVERHFDEISDAIGKGRSFRAIYAQMAREGHAVGRGHSSLFSAYNVVKGRRGETPAALPSSAPEMPSAVVDSRRKTTKW